VENEALRLLSAEDRLEGSEEITEVTVKEALERDYIRSEWQAVFMALQKKLLVDLGIPSEKQRFIEKHPWERAHYSSQTFDQEVLVERWGWIEVNACACRTDYDLKRHSEFSGQDMYVFKEYEKPIKKEQITIKPVMAKLGPTFKKEAAKVAEVLSKTDPKEVETVLKQKGYFMLDSRKILPEHVDIKHEKILERGRRFIPYVIEPTFGSDRLFYVAFEHAYRIKDDRTLLSFPRDIAPVQVSVYPLMSKDELPEKALELHRMLLNEGFVAEYDDAGSIGRRYARADEAGIPLSITVDYDTLRDETVTIRDRDTWKQVRNRIEELPELLHRYFRWKINFEELGAPI
jgi:glycyl-tRNA synthetase